MVNIEFTSCTMYYCNIINVLQLLLGHSLFKNSFTYALKRYYTSTNNIHMYNKIHMEDGWWSLQEQLGKWAITVLFLLATDKTIFTQHYGNLKTWPLYVIIWNLDVSTRKNQTQSSMVLLSLISMAKLGKKHYWKIKSVIYHRAIRIILEHIYYLRQTHPGVIVLT